MPTSRKTAPAKAATRNTDSGPSKPPPSGDDAASRQKAETEAMAAAMPFNAHKAKQFGQMEAADVKRLKALEQEKAMLNPLRRPSTSSRGSR